MSDLWSTAAAMFENLRSVIQFRELEFDPVERRLSRCANVDDLREICRRRLPGGVFDYIDGGAEDELTMDRNSRGFDDWEFRPRVLRDVSHVDTTTQVLGRAMPLPLILSPTGLGRVADSQGELAVCRAAARAGIPYTLSTMATRSIEEVEAAHQEAERSDDTIVDPRRWFQVYVFKDRGLVKELIERAALAGYESIMITVDTVVVGRRERDMRRGFTLPPQLGLDTILDGAIHPSWTWDFLRAEPIKFPNVVGRSTGDGLSAVELAGHAARQFDPKLSWEDVEFFQSIWDGPVTLKGIQTVEDAKIAADMGLAGIALSNHGGRQLDGAPAPIDLVSPVVDAVGGEIEIYCDGGVRRGSDILKAVSLGATAAMIGRAYLYGLGAGGERGVDWVLDFLAAGLRQSMALCGVRSFSEVGPDLVRRRCNEAG